MAEAVQYQRLTLDAMRQKSTPRSGRQLKHSLVQMSQKMEFRS